MIQSARLLLRKFSLADASLFFELNNDPEVMQYTGDVAFESIASTEEFIEAYCREVYSVMGFGRWTVIRNSDGQCLGWCGLKRHPDGMVDLGYRLAKAYWGNGYATESAEACIKFGFEDLQLTEIVGRTASANMASIRVLEKVGMKFWKKAPCEGIEDSVYYRISRLP
ncbi:MAG: GNAT family N-acetyltransferase [Bacteroidota bacterium]